MTDYSHMHTHTYVHILIASWNIEVKYLQRVKKMPQMLALSQ